jgi:hypothetical protein
LRLLLPQFLSFSFNGLRKHVGCNDMSGHATLVQMLMQIMLLLLL